MRVDELVNSTVGAVSSSSSSFTADDVVQLLQVALSTEIKRHMRHANVSPHVQVSWLLHGGCDPVQDTCRYESTRVLVLLVSLSSLMVLVACALCFFREDKEEQITPLCPQLVVKDSDLEFKMPLGSEADTFLVTDRSGEPVCKASLEWPDPFRPGATGVAATVKLQSTAAGTTLATVVARNVAVVGQGLALCRSGAEIFGFVEVEAERHYLVRHRTGVHLLTLYGDFDSIDIEGINPVGSKVCSIQKSSDGIVYGRVLQHMDAGLVICSLLATHVHRRLSKPPTPTPSYGGAWDPAAGFARPVPSPPVRDATGSTTNPDRRAGEEETAASSEAPMSGATSPAIPPPREVPNDAASRPPEEASQAGAEATLAQAKAQPFS